MTHWRQARRLRWLPATLCSRFNVYLPPVPVLEIVQRLGVEVYEITDRRVAAALQVQGDLAKMYVRGDEPEERQRFALAHLLGHLIEDRTLPESRIETTYGDEGCWWANRYAQHLLVPWWMANPLARPMRYDADAMARLFQVPRGAFSMHFAMVGAT